VRANPRHLEARFLAYVPHGMEQKNPLGNLQKLQRKIPFLGSQLEENLIEYFLSKISENSVKKVTGKIP
jgi:hypothetical protein